MCAKTEHIHPTSSAYEHSDKKENLHRKGDTGEGPTDNSSRSKINGVKHALKTQLRA